RAPRRRPPTPPPPPRFVGRVAARVCTPDNGCSRRRPRPGGDGARPPPAARDRATQGNRPSGPDDTGRGAFFSATGPCPRTPGPTWSPVSPPPRRVAAAQG